MLRFNWDKGKNKTNTKKHDVSFEEAQTVFFEEAQTVFFDEYATEFFDPEHSEEENRYVMLGLSFRFRILVVSYCYRENEDVVRIISARKATKKEQKEYTGGRK